VHYQNVVPGLGPVDRSEIVKGYEYQKGRYVTIEPADLEQLHLDTTDTIDITQFIDVGDLDPVYVDKPYYLVPDGSLAEEGYRVIRESLRDSGTAAIGQVVINMRERIVAIRPYDQGLLVNALRFPDEVRAADQFFAGIEDEPLDQDELALMRQIITRRTRKFEPDKFVDHYQAALKNLVKEKLAGTLPARPPEHKPAQVIDLMDALKRSLTEESADTAGPASHRIAPKKRLASPADTRGKAGPRRPSKSQPSLLLPVAGGRQNRTAAASAEASKRRRKA
jgi:DNA end-binding protein Ku